MDYYDETEHSVRYVRYSTDIKILPDEFKQDKTENDLIKNIKLADGNIIKLDEYNKML